MRDLSAPRKVATLREVAEAAGVSIATVSKVVNGRFEGMTASTRERVEAAVRELAYRPNRAGRSLRSARQSRIAMLIVDPSPRFLVDPFITNIVAGISNEVSMRGYGLLLSRIDPEEPESSYIVKGQEADALAVLLSGTAPEREHLLARLAVLGHPMVVFQQEMPGSVEDVCTVRQDDLTGARQLARRILERRPRRALCLLPRQRWPAIEARLQGFEEVLAPAGVTLSHLRCDEGDMEGALDALREHLAAGPLPDVIIGTNDRLAVVAVEVLQAMGCKVPEDVGVSGFNAFPFTTPLRPRLATVRSPAYRLGELGARLLIERIEQGAFGTRESVLPVELVEGESL
ncbi:LacI family DNA-binding transcriptional regulator [Geminicoccaceae bacterium 1502E]|nr:LacI family DNA-binding transcriptional regulator [Geminicoccaceae bacterium 1502E]